MREGALMLCLIILLSTLIQYVQTGTDFHPDLANLLEQPDAASIELHPSNSDVEMKALKAVPQQPSFTSLNLTLETGSLFTINLYEQLKQFCKGITLEVSLLFYITS